MKTFKITIARILTNYPAKVFIVQAPDIVSAQIRVWRKVKTWHHVIAAEQSVHPTPSSGGEIPADVNQSENDKPAVSG